MAGIQINEIEFGIYFDFGQKYEFESETESGQKYEFESETETVLFKGKLPKMNGLDVVKIWYKHHEVSFISFGKRRINVK